MQLKKSVKYKSVPASGTFFYLPFSSETIFYPIDSVHFFDLLSAGVNDPRELATILFSEYELSEQESLIAANNAITSLKEKSLLDELDN